MMLRPIAAFLHRYKITANQITLFGLGLSVWAADWIWAGRFFSAGLIVLAAGFCDLLDGQIAKLNPSRNKFGALLDSAVDRYSDALYFGGLMLYCIGTQSPLYATLAFSACVAAFEISYVRARAGSIGVDCRLGFWERGERVVTLVLGLVTGNIYVMLWILGVFPHVTAVKRILFVKQSLSGSDQFVSNKSRRNRKYIISAIAIVLSIILIRL